MEIEIKLAAEGTVPEAILRDPEILASETEAVRTIPMSTTYYDDAGNSLSAARCTLRLRREGERYVATMKTPCGIPGARNEYEAEAPDILTGIPLLVDAGAPESLLEIGQLRPVCGAEFTRRAVLLRLKDCCAELALDKGRLFREDRELPFSELELELKDGDPASMNALAARLSERYALREEPLSKFARARNL